MNFVQNDTAFTTNACALERTPTILWTLVEVEESLHSVTECDLKQEGSHPASSLERQNFWL